ncbi:P-loop containing nucleoside triphosphate hydrolase protein [Armillaria novae-zelandiae]|uniref:P-loop containing nucleoside triphosphate hydrolase protein n=1 Tax=Armillaria novae-zelandiae TaxID=153914 RepID=A0AA39UBF5_9AGAR|nr:P-loop containing nucleoside triphosphate hydrolase protein [Armillaria novae-zelandiae]
MPTFQPPQSSGKRKSDQPDVQSRKRQALDVGAAGSSEYWMVQWRNHQSKKHKTWEGDGVVVVEGSQATLFDTDGKQIGQTACPPSLYEGLEMSIGGKDVGLECRTTRAEYHSGTCFGQATAVSAPLVTSARPSNAFAPLKLSTLPRLNTVSTERKGVPLEQVDLLSPQCKSPAKENITSLESHWTANWRKVGNKKNWEGDAYVSHTEKIVMFISETGKKLSTSAWKGTPLQNGQTLYFGGKEVQLLNQVSLSELPCHSGIAEAPTNQKPTALSGANDSVKKFATPLSTGGVSPATFYGSVKKPAKPLHDPDAEGAIVMKPPTKEHIQKYNKKNGAILPVVLDPVIASKLRPHQIEGVKFMYECVMGLRKHEGRGCILADEMGLGKTLQTISLVWTLLRQNPYSGMGPVVEKVLIVCPVSLINNWKAEFYKWLGRDRVGVTVCDKEKNAIPVFINSKPQKVLIIGYERLRTVIKTLGACVPPIWLIVCDEGHRLKSANNKTTAMFDALRTPRRIILSGTPIQNDLGEFHAMADFCNPGLLDEYGVFRRVYEAPILKSRAPDCTTKDTEIGEARLAQLMLVAKSFVLRREAKILGNYLPPKHEYVVFITPTNLQLSIFSKLLQPDKLEDLVHGSTAESLALMNLLTKVSNSPILLKATADKEGASGEQDNTIRKRSVREALGCIPETARLDDMSLSGKLSALSRLLEHIKNTTEEKCVLVSHYTSTLNILEAYCKKMHYSYYRLDGQTPTAKRQEFVNIFNKTSQTSSFIFLLSSKAGGVGINLIGGSRLCLIDSDWNPSHDLQSMARCHRDGQKRPVYIYRFLTAGTIDEKIFQRQVTKLGLSNSLMGSGSGSSKSDSFTRKDLRDIFRIHPDTLCNTHDLLECPCDVQSTASSSQPESTLELDDNDTDSESDSHKGFVVASQVSASKLNKMDRAYAQKKKEGLAALGEWKHINCISSDNHKDIQDGILREIMHVPEPKSGKDSQSRTQRLMAQLDIVGANGLRGVSGGTISFLFQKSTEGAGSDSPSSEV